MLFRKRDGTIVEINRMSFKTDSLYYQKIMELYQENKLKSFEKNKTDDDFVSAKMDTARMLKLISN